MAETTQQYPKVSVFDIDGDFSPKKQAPLDCRNIADSYAALKAGNHTYTYNGLVVSCVLEKAQYLCIDATNANSDLGWKKLGGGAGSGYYGTSSIPSANDKSKILVTLVNSEGWKLANGTQLVVNFTQAVDKNASLYTNKDISTNEDGTDATTYTPIFYKGSAIKAGVIAAGSTIQFVYYDNKYHVVGDYDFLSKNGGTMTGGISWETSDGVESTINADGYEYNGINVVSMDDDGDVVVTGDKIAKEGGTSDQILLADGSTTTVMKDDEIITAINTAWDS